MTTPREGETHTVAREFAREDVERFADLSGDRQPRHLEPDADGRLLVHGLLTATLPTSVGGDQEWLATRMDLHFRQPVYTGERVECTVEVTDVTERDDRFDLEADATCRNEDGDVVLRGTVEGLVWKE